MRGDTLEPCLLGDDQLALGLYAYAQQLSDLVRVMSLQDLGNLIERETTIFERQDARQITELRQVIETVAALRMDVRRAQEPQCIVVS